MFAFSVCAAGFAGSFFVNDFDAADFEADLFTVDFTEATLDDLLFAGDGFRAADFVENAFFRVVLFELAARVLTGALEAVFFRAVFSAFSVFAAVVFAGDSAR